MEKGFRETVENKGRWVLTDEMLKVHGELKSNAGGRHYKKPRRREGGDTRTEAIQSSDQTDESGSGNEAKKEGGGEAVLKKIGKKSSRERKGIWLSNWEDVINGDPQENVSPSFDDERMENFILIGNSDGIPSPRFLYIKRSFFPPFISHAEVVTRR
ncbi:hypothetical protein TNCV_1721731 [Trichonephila clavipes]|nr:hypothetical protein TNCV_1721731 [Trichonephila clavipes]